VKNKIKPQAAKPAAVPMAHEIEAVYDWAWRDQDECRQCCDSEEGSAEIKDNMEMIERTKVGALRVMSANAELVEAASRVEAMLSDDWPCECYGKPDAVYEKGEKCPPCALRAALRAAGDGV